MWVRHGSERIGADRGKETLRKKVWSFVRRGIEGLRNVSKGSKVVGFLFEELFENEDG